MPCNSAEAADTFHFNDTLHFAIFSNMLSSGHFRFSLTQKPHRHFIAKMNAPPCDSISRLRALYISVLFRLKVA